MMYNMTAANNTSTVNISLSVITKKLKLLLKICENINRLNISRLQSILKYSFICSLGFYISIN